MGKCKRYECDITCQLKRFLNELFQVVIAPCAFHKVFESTKTTTKLNAIVLSKHRNIYFREEKSLYFGWTNNSLSYLHFPLALSKRFDGKNAEWWTDCVWLFPTYHTNWFKCVRNLFLLRPHFVCCAFSPFDKIGTSAPM